MLPAMPSPPFRTFARASDRMAGLGTTSRKHWVPPLGAMNRSSPRVAFFSTQNKGECWPIFSDFFQALTPIIRLTFFIFFVFSFF
jgi:hypothetical protein